jgi:uncharacterized protein (DUF427 family)
MTLAEFSSHYKPSTIGPMPSRERLVSLAHAGDASHYNISGGEDRSLKPAWTYETPFETMAQIKGCVAFYPDRGGADAG